MDRLRYQRQMILPEIGIMGQNKLAQGKVLCIGAGGLGAPVLLYLAAAGVGTIGIVDGDVVDISNLQRQVLFQNDDVGKKKVFCAKRTLNALNPDVIIHCYDEFLSVENCIELFEKYDVIVDGSDNFTAKYLINDAATKIGKPVVYGSIMGFDGQVSIFEGQKESPCYRCLYPTIPNVPIKNCAEAGVLGSSVGLLGAIQSLQTIYALLGRDHCTQHGIEPLFGKLWVGNLKNMDSRILTIPKAKDCCGCGKYKKDMLLETVGMSMCSSTNDMLAKNIKDFKGVIVDVREEHERVLGSIADSISIPYSLIQINPDILSQSLDQNIPYLIYCQSGVRSKNVVQIMDTLSFKIVYNLYGGYNAFTKKVP